MTLLMRDQENREIGREEGRKEEREEIVINMYNNNLTIEQISKLTLMSFEDVTKIVDEYKRTRGTV